MCLAIPARVVTLHGDTTATVEVGGVRKRISILLVDDEAKVDDYVLVHVGYALSVIEPEEAEQTLALFEELGAFDPVEGTA